MTEQQLIRRFVDAMERLDDSVFKDESPPPEELVAGIDTESAWNRILWKPRAIVTPRDALDVIHSRIQPLPDLFEELVLSYRWVSVHLVVCRLFANPQRHPVVDVGQPGRGGYNEAVGAFGRLDIRPSCSFGLAAVAGRDEPPDRGGTDAGIPCLRG